MADQPLLKLTNVHKRFYLPGRQILRAVNGVSLELAAGECLAIVGESGCGKSTLARLIARVEPVSEGEIHFAGEPIMGLRGDSLRALRRKMQIIFQDPISEFSPRMKIGEFLREPFLNFSLLSKKDAGEKALSLLASVDLSESFAQRYPHQLSGGELQRVAIARAIALDPLLLICDEPTSALDVSIQERIVRLLGDLRQSSDISLLFISHDLTLVSQLSDRIAVMYLGYVLEQFPSPMLVGGARHPYTKALYASTFRVEAERGQGIEVLGGETPSAIDLPAGCPFRLRCPEAEPACGQSVPPLREISPGHFAACVKC
ncbi:MAG: ABC transporter ATP-binding protein [Clostridiales bacterium]|nr:ABC transporter ATP-binding protein [Clostridiales bacterium]